jgi:hypothetical protein
MKRIAVTGWIEKDATETEILEYCLLDKDFIRGSIENVLWPRKKAAVEARDTLSTGIEFKRVRVSVEIDVEEL